MSYVNAHVPIAFTTFFDCIEYKLPGKSSQMNDTSGTQKIARHMGGGA